MEILRMTHDITRWLIVIVGIATIVKFAIGWLQKSAFTGIDRGLSSGYSGLIDLQVLLGIIFFFWTGFSGVGFPGYRIEHAVTLLIAAVMAHLPLRWKSAPDTIRFRNSFIAILVSMFLIYFGVASVNGWS